MDGKQESTEQSALDALVTLILAKRARAFIGEQLTEADRLAGEVEEAYRAAYEDEEDAMVNFSIALDREV